ncbi:MAG: hypothetical protein ACKOC5_06520 [Chloroflexota bacterium]
MPEPMQAKQPNQRAGVEDRLLLLCSRVVLDDAAAGQAAALLSVEIDWDYLRQASIRHGLAPLFYHGLRRLAQRAAPVPGAVLDDLARLYQAGLAQPAPVPASRPGGAGL